MEVRNNYTPAFTGCLIKSSRMNPIQRDLSHKISTMLDYSDEYVRLDDAVDVYFLPGKSEKSIVVKFMDTFSDMFFTKGKSHVKTSIHSENSNYSKSVDDIRAVLNDIEAGKLEVPEDDETKYLNASTDLAKLDAGIYD